MSEQGLFHLEVKQGSTYRQPFVWKVEDAAGVRTPQSLAGYTARMQVRPSENSTTVWATLTTEGAEGYSAAANLTLEKNGVTGAIEIYIGATVTAQFPRDGVYDLELHLDGDENEVITLLGGRVLVETEVTR